MAKGQRDGFVIFTRFNTGVWASRDRREHRIQIGVAVPLNDPNEHGPPHGDEHDELNAIEDLVVEVAGERATLVGVITTQSMREFVLYARDHDWIAGFHEELRRRVAHHEVQVMGQRDPDWETYRTFVPDELR